MFTVRGATRRSNLCHTVTLNSEAYMAHTHHGRHYMGQKLIENHLSILVHGTIQKVIQNHLSILVHGTVQKVVQNHLSILVHDTVQKVIQNHLPILLHCIWSRK